MVSINNILDGVISKLSNEFGSKYEIYNENVSQGIVKPCFAVVSTSPLISRVRDNIFKYQNKITVHYFPENMNFMNKEFNDIIERLYSALDIIKLDDGSLLRGINMSNNITDDVLHFFVNFDCFVTRVDNISSLDGEYMENLHTKFI